MGWDPALVLLATIYFNDWFVAGNDSRKLHSLDPRPCEECGKVYSNLSNLRQHMKLIHYPTYVQCQLCKKSFKTDLYLRRHIISAHGGLTNGYFKSSLNGDLKTGGISTSFKYLNINKLHKNGVDVKYERGSNYINNNKI